jgi:hypothetical protein
MTGCFTVLVQLLEQQDNADGSTISPTGDDTSNVTSATTNSTTNKQTPTILEIMSSDEASPIVSTSTKSPTDNKASDTSTTVV